MKVGILTQPIHWNYGGILQNWALQQVLRQMGHEPIKLELTFHWIYLGIFRSILANLKTSVLRFLNRNVNRSIVHINWFGSDTLSLRGLNLKKTRPIFNNNDLKKRAYKIEAFIVGSDQVWREEYSPAITDFFFGFLEDSDCRPRVSYAASFGKSKDYISKSKLPECKKLLHRFTSVSIREREGLNILRDDFGYHNATLVLDPTLMLSASDYLKIAEKTKPIGKPYISAYFLDETKEKNNLIDDLSKVIGITTIDLIGAKFEKFEKARVPGIGGWIRSIADSEFVITDSFHGMAFSLIFHRPFIIVANANRGLDRYKTVLGPLGLMERLVSDCSIDIDTVVRKTIDWTSVDNYLNEQKKLSRSFLETSLTQQ